MEIYLVILVAIAGLFFSLIKSSWISKQDPGNDVMRKISGYIADGALAFLKAEYKALSIFVVAVAIIIGVLAEEETSHWTEEHG